MYYCLRTVHSLCNAAVGNKYIILIGWGGVDWIGVTQVRDKWRAVVNAVMNLRVP
jgi:hypothetical protein